ncbi:Not1 N-terminal domain, CCR4-Not complex component-domain-containing protein [Gamsiella multidivaricata]|uniref:Not1 N-terminal domain, CCR4-Not complex component-domain-containing protein n=1 Tax=Gamsiella multidivaricata TaxID=101098 RepID=UPI00221E788F|nr:Not1 N-terminal domain, CCR4-Not complex component-domain-containing protein [Gamsiella multidivaricata]KAG0364115.1 general negative regulator of transcription subunit 5 [Gamsiella multidivaricata]KAI7832476.1 Not1 N-terminal domain, CCR4-Not complex component-domain-containing protein [Gamsiella multidivaricata]
MATRKLQTEIDKVLKKVAEGVETFEETLQKIETSTNANQKEKYESDLKKEIKKLQRQRDQIKTWLSSNDIKDKRALLENRKLIEHQMERFKAIEKEMKTKAYSREGLIMSGRLDPKEKEKAETCSWVTEKVEALNIQVEGLEAEVETLQAITKKGKNNPNKERILELEEKIERHKWHQGRLELILRLLENGQIESDKVIAIQEDVNYYVDENMDDNFAEDEEIYTDLNLEDEEDYFTVGTGDHHGGNKDDEYSEKSTEDHEPPPKKQLKEVDPEPTPSPVKATAKPTPTKKLSVSETKETKVTPAASPAAAKSTVNGPSSRQSTIPRAGSVESPVIQYATAVAANLPTESPRTAPLSASPSVTAAVVTKDSPKPAAAKAETPSPKMAVKTAATVAPSPTPSVPTPTSSQTQAQAQTVSSPATLPLVTATDVPKTATVSVPTTIAAEPSSAEPAAQSTAQDPVGKDSASVQAVPAQPPAAIEPEIRLPAALADLAHSFEASKERAMSKEVGFFVHQMLEASYQFIPEAADTERPKHYAPKNPYPTPSYYPQTPPAGLFDNAAMFEKFDIDTLFFIFYYQQGTYQQYLAARELKKQSWRFHKKFLTWFQRHEEPKAITDDYEQGTYIYFDYEGAWCQRKKTDFRFEYKFLEDAELV